MTLSTRSRRANSFRVAFSAETDVWEQAHTSLVAENGHSGILADADLCRCRCRDLIVAGYQLRPKCGRKEETTARRLLGPDPGITWLGGRIRSNFNSLSDEGLQAPEIAISDSELLKMRNCLSQVLGARSPMAGCR